MKPLYRDTKKAIFIATHEKKTIITATNMKEIFAVV